MWWAKPWFLRTQLLLSRYVASVVSSSVQPRRWQPTRLPHPWDSPGKNTGVGCHVLLQCRKVKSESEVAQLCPTLSDPMDCSLPGSSNHGIFQARVLGWVPSPSPPENTEMETNDYNSGGEVFCCCCCLAHTVILVLSPGIELMLPALGAHSLNHWTTREVTGCEFLTVV